SEAPVAASAGANAWRFGFTPQAETWNGRFAMLGFIIALAIEVLSDKGILHALEILPSVSP
ncbi:MAG: hypothetical protein HC925_08730, partial [Coleofasciculaceae cyanobacterium SM2_3_26]|nr:hypothetical protein [Coleofasciculaceae cyanobacterium SM2_3_26]